MPLNTLLLEGVVCIQLRLVVVVVTAVVVVVVVVVVVCLFVCLFVCLLCVCWGSRRCEGGGGGGGSARV